jgi:predicted nuclease of predicted toxin-antitoxin system
MRFLVDAQLPPALARWLVARGYEASHVSDHSLQSAADRHIWEFAAGCSAIIVTKDEDFALRRGISENGPSIIWIRFPNSRRRDLIEWFDRALPGIIEALERHEAIIEVS